ncbi:dephospho-CoA kinase [Frigidibacter mobilis]|uniref:Dephospho-CoA kinase n=1 Tax=Frigidibacter mobilis TaxID=1335048 RepID=A0A159ZAB8_9RHOB|nr:dephospho-CoA kinase [Frigidibacter mobilis]AMY71744.1 dephospho-CoA kinase [Frigidibacter mobilis]
MSGPFRLGLTGSIGMGKSTTAAMFAEAGVPVWDADAAVHRIYAPGGAAVPAIAALQPQAVKDGGVDRALLKDWIARDPGALARIERAVHPLVAADREAFLEQSSDKTLVVLDIPLLFETGAEARMDAVLVVSAPAEVQRARVLARPGMTPAQLDLILSRQMPDAEKRARATWVIETTGLEATRAAVQDLIETIRARHA